LFGLSSAKSKPWETAGRRATELKEGSPSDASRAARVVNALAVFCVFREVYNEINSSGPL